MREVGRHRVMRKRRETDFPAASGHVDGLIDGGFGTGTLDHIIRADPAGELFDHIDRILLGDIDDAVRAQLLADREALVARSSQDDRACSQRLGNGDSQEPDRTRADHDHAFAGNQATQFGQAVHRGPGGDDQCCFRIAHRVRHPRQRVDMVDGVFGETTIGGETVGAMTLVGFSVVEA